ncbi:hypothetical protein ACSBR2_018973 [Camellia fascicularis]
MGLRIRRLFVLGNRDFHEWRSEFKGLIGPNVSFTDGAPNSEDFCVCQSSFPRRALRIGMLIRPKRVIHGSGSEFGGFLCWPIMICTKGAPNSET